jgi:hypothetical protein
MTFRCPRVADSRSRVLGVRPVDDRMAVHRFERANCGGINIQFCLTVVALVVGVAFFIALRDHRESLRGLKTRANFDVKLRPPPAADTDGVVRVVTTVRLEIGIKRHGRPRRRHDADQRVARELSGFVWWGPAR